MSRGMLDKQECNHVDLMIFTTNHQWLPGRMKLLCRQGGDSFIRGQKQRKGGGFQMMVERSRWKLVDLDS